jgi:hypothetical protein
MNKEETMRKVIAIVLVLAIALAAAPAYAAPKGVKGASASAYEHASDEAVFHRVGDWFATRGKTPEEKQTILTERKAKRTAKRAEKEAAKAKKEAASAQKKLEKEMKGAGKKTFK